MGLFKTKKKTYVNTTVSRMVEDEDIIPSNKMAVLDYTMSQASASVRLTSDSLSDYLLKATTNNIVARARKSRRYAEKSTYAFGLPEASMVQDEGVDIKSAINRELSAIYPEGVIVKDAYFGPMNNFYFLRKILQNKYDYNQDTNTLGKESKRIGFTCYMESAQIVYSKYSNIALVDPDTLMQYGESAESGKTPFREYNQRAAQVPWKNDGDLDHDVAIVTVVYKDAAGSKQTYTLTIDYLEYERSSKEPSTGLDDSDTNKIDPNAEAPIVAKTLDGQDFYQANYEYVLNGVTHKDTFIYLYGSGLSDRLDNLFKVGDKFGQYIPRIYARLQGEKLNKEENKDKPEYKSMVGICRQTGFNWVNWVDEVHNSVGSLDKVTQIYMTYSLPANTQDKLILSYLFDYFSALYEQIPNDVAQTNYGDLRAELLNTGSKSGQSFEIKDNYYTQRMSFDSIGYIDVTGSIGSVGSVEHSLDNQTVQIGRQGSHAPFRPTSNVTCHIYRKQLTTTTYREFKVFGLSVTELVDGGHETRAAGDSEELLIPLDLSVTSGFTMRELELLYSKAMYIVLNTVQVVKTKWYQTGVFKAIMFIVAVVVSYFFPPAGVAAYSWAAAVYAVVQAVVIGLVIQVAVKLLVKIGVDVGAAAAIIAIIALLYGGYTGLTKTTGVGGVTTMQVLQVSSQAFSASSQGYALQTQKAIKEFNSLMADLSAEDADLQRKARELGLGQHGPLLMFEPPIDIGVRMGESPDDYFERSVHITNVASIVYSFTEMNVDIGLSLPTTNTILNSLKETADELPILRL